MTNELLYYCVPLDHPNNLREARNSKVAVLVFVDDDSRPWKLLSILPGMGNWNHVVVLGKQEGELSGLPLK
jgi:hypothetical protein